MEKVNKPERLVGCNMKVYRSNGHASNSYDRINEIHKIMGINNIYNCIFIYEKNVCNANTFDLSEIKLVLDDDFIKKFKSEKIAINCETEQEAINFCNWMHRKGLKWFGGDSYQDDSSYISFTSNTCYTQLNAIGNYSSFSFYKEKDYTIVKFSDCVIEKDFIDTPEFDEFIEFFKKRDAYVKFDNQTDKNKFFKKINNDLVNCPNINSFPYGIYNRCTERVWNSYYNGDKPCIDYKNLKNWKEILNVKDDKKTMENEKTYKIVKPITIKSILDSASGYYFKWIGDFISKHLVYNSYMYGITDYKEFCKYNLNQYLYFFIDNGFIEEVNNFEPFDLNIKVETKAQLSSLLQNFESINREVK